MRPVERVPAVVAEVAHETHILVQLLGGEAGRASPLEDRKIRVLGHLEVAGRLCGEELLEARDDLVRRHVRRRGEESLAQHHVAAQHHGLDVLARVARVVHRDLGLARERKAQGPGAVVGLPEVAAGQVAHVEARHEEGRGDPQLADVLLNCRLTVEMVDVRECSLCHFCVKPVLVPV